MVLRHSAKAVVILPSADGKPKPQTDIEAHVGARIEFLRIQKGLSRELAALHLGISLELLRKYESGRLRIKVDHLIAIAVLLKTSMGYFFEEFDIYDRASRLDR